MLWNWRSVPPTRLVPAAIFVAFIFTLLVSDWSREYTGFFVSQPATPANKIHPTIPLPDLEISAVRDTAQYFADFPLGPPYKNVFGELGRRTQVLRDWIAVVDGTKDDAKREHLQHFIEAVAAASFPFLRNPPRNTLSTSPLADLRSSYDQGSVGIVIPTGDATVRFAAHLIGALRSVLGSTLPIEVVYAGDGDLSQANRENLAQLKGAGPALEFVDITTVFDDKTLKLASGKWAIKPFAALGSRFEKVIALDADAVLLQPPERLLQQQAFVNTGAYLFHDRLLWQHAYQDRHQWWKDQIRRPSAALNKSLVWMQDYAEEGDSGVVVLDKSRLDVFAALLHICWQNSYAVREEVTYKITYGDKESWWLGLELAGARYQMEQHYGAIIGWEEPDAEGRPKVCSFVIAHVDEQDRLLWYNGGLLKNKGQEGMQDVYEVPQKWMMDADWEKGATKQDMSCMARGVVRTLAPEETRVLSQSIETAKRLDQTFHVTLRKPV